MQKVLILNNFNKNKKTTKTPTFYYSILKNADCILEPFPFGGLNSTYDALTVNQAVISLPSDFLSGRFTYGLYKKINFYLTINNNEEEYIENVINYANNKNNLRDKCKLYLKANKFRLFQDNQSVLEYNKILKLLAMNII